MTVSITTPSIMTVSLSKKCVKSWQSVCVKALFADCSNLAISLNVVMLSDIMDAIVMDAVKLSVVILSVTMLSFVMLSVIMLREYCYAECHYAECHNDYHCDGCC
jgi:hypothetical protein